MMEIWNKNTFHKGLITFYLSDTQHGARVAYRALCQGRLIMLLLLVVLLLGMTACAEQPTPYKPPTIAARATSAPPIRLTSTISPHLTASPSATATLTCTDNLTFLKNLTLPYGATVKPGESLDKRWLVENSGTCDWDEAYRLKLIGGGNLGAPEAQALYPARRGTQATVRMSLTAPTDPGVYQSAWQAYNPQGEAFGDPVFIQIVVEPTNP